MEVLDIGEVDMAIGDVACAEKNWACAAELVVLRSLAVANLKQAIVDELLKSHLLHFTRHNPAPSCLL